MNLILEEEIDSDESAVKEESSDEEDDSETDEEIPDVGEEPGKAKQQIENPLFEESGDPDSDSEDFDDSDDSDDEDDYDDGEDKAIKPKGFEGEDDLIATLKAAREKKVRESPPDIK